MVTLDTTQKFVVTVAPVDANGKPGAIDSPPTYPVDTPGICTILPSADGLSCEVRGFAVGTCTITPTAIANGKTIVAPGIDVTVTAPPPQPAVQLIETVGQVVSQ